MLEKTCKQNLDDSQAASWTASKGQLISKGLFGGIVSTKKPTEFF